MKKMLITILACLSLSGSSIEALGSSADLFNTENYREFSIEKSCKRGPRGHRGEKGKKGHLGKEGINEVSEFGEAYLIGGPTPSLVPFLSPTPEVVQFTETGPLSHNITYDPSTWTFTVNATGTYTIEYGAIASTPFIEGLNNPILVMITEVLIDGTPDVTLITPAVIPALGALKAQEKVQLIPTNTTYSSFVNATNQITRDLTVGTTLSFRVAVNQITDYIPIWGIGVPGEQAAYLSIKKIEEKRS